MATLVFPPAPPLPPDWRLRAGIAALCLALLAGLLLALAPSGPAPHAPDASGLATPVTSAPPPVPAPVLEPLSREAARAANAAQPLLGPGDPAAPFRLAAPAAEDRDRARDCLAAAAWYEAGDDPSGERAVAQVVLNRARHPAFAPGVCGVVFEGADPDPRPGLPAQAGGGCQFTFACDGSLGTRRPSPAAWVRARAIAGAALAGAVDPRVGWATHYHADYVAPYWRHTLDKAAQVGLHLFYRWPGAQGTAPAFTRRPDARLPEPVEPLLARLSPAHAGDAQARQLALLLQAQGPGWGDDDTVTLDGHAVSTSTPPIPALPPASAPTAGDAAAIRLVFPPDQFPGRHALLALEACAHRPRCLVLAWQGAPDAPQDPATLAFVYRRDRAGGGEGAWWDCTRTPRGDPAQCLPSPARRAALLSPAG